MSYYNLAIDRRKIVTSVYEKCVVEGYENYLIGSLENKDGLRFRLKIEVENKKFFLDFLFNKNYKTTIQTGQGTNKELQEEFAKYLSEDKNLLVEDYLTINKAYENETGYVQRSNDTIVYKKVDEDTFQKLLIALNEEACCEKIDKEREEENVTICKANDAEGNIITLTHFISRQGHTIMVQGNPKILFAVCASDIAELIGKEENLRALNEFYGTNTSLEEIESEYESMFVNAKANLNLKMKKTICQALQNRRDLGEKFDYTYLAQPAERALEGHIRYALAGCLTGRNINVFTPIKDANGNIIEYNLQHAHYSCLGNNMKKIKAIEKAYTYMHFVRNQLEHWDNPNAFGQDTTRLLTNNEVDKTIMGALKLIEEFYS